MFMEKLDTVQITRIITQLKAIWDGKLWADVNLKEKVSAINETNAFIQPIKDMRSIAEIVSHMLVWRQYTINTIKGSSNTLTMESPDNWKSNELLKPIGWKNLLDAFESSNEELITLLNEKDDTFLKEEYKSGSRFDFLLEGIIHHDLYHLGQIGITLKFLPLTQ
jgi:uncharacterized damage-inducible protein DinB